MQTNFLKYAKISAELFTLTLRSKGKDKETSSMAGLAPENGVCETFPTNSVLIV
jgi:hypothetical protein